MTASSLMVTVDTMRTPAGDHLVQVALYLRDDDGDRLVVGVSPSAARRLAAGLAAAAAEADRVSATIDT